jgi:hypothetical protein
LVNCTVVDAAAGGWGNVSSYIRSHVRSVKEAKVFKGFSDGELTGLFVAAALVLAAWIGGFAYLFVQGVRRGGTAVVGVGGRVGRVKKGEGDDDDDDDEEAAAGTSDRAGLLGGGVKKTVEMSSMPVSAAGGSRSKKGSIFSKPQQHAA